MAADEEPTDPPVEHDDDDESEDELEWNVGFAEDPESPTELYRHRFPSKVGGAPAWLQPVKLPSPETLTCPITNKPMNFLLQVYAPLDHVNPDAFHRTLFLFVSPQGNQLTKAGAVRCLRAQLPRANDFYSSQPPSDTDIDPPPLTPAQQEVVDALDPWSKGYMSSSKPTVFKEYNLVVQPDEEAYSDEEGEEGEDEEGDAEKYARVDMRTRKILKEYAAREARDGVFPTDEMTATEDALKDMGGLSADKMHMAAFCTKISRFPQQCVRYCLDERATPLTPAPSPPSPKPEDIPRCSCGASRQFEFQVLPQLMHYLEQDDSLDTSLDFATLAIYSCSASCDRWQGDTAYVEEFVWVQPPMNEK